MENQQTDTVLVPHTNTVPRIRTQRRETRRPTAETEEVFETEGELPLYVSTRRRGGPGRAACEAELEGVLYRRTTEGSAVSGLRVRQAQLAPRTQPKHLPLTLRGRKIQYKPVPCNERLGRNESP